MAGNFVAGLVWGGLVAGLGLAVISPMAPLVGPKMGQPMAAGTETAVEALVEEPKIAEAEPAVSEPAVSVSAESVSAESVSAEPATAEPAATEPVPEPAAQSEPAVDPNKDAILLPVQPEVAAEPAAKPADVTTADPEPAMVEAALAPPEPASEVAPAVDTVEPKADEPMVAAPEVPEPEAPASTEPAEPEEPAAPEEPAVAAAPQENAAPATTAEVTPAPAEPAATDPAATAPAVTAPAATEPEVAAVPVDPTAGVTTGRLPSVGQTDAAPEVAPEIIAPASDATPLVRFARPFENVTGNPPMAILLIDDGSETLDRAALAALPFPVTFVLDPLAFNAPEAAAIYRAAGQEIAMLATGIPEGATAADLEQTFQTHDAVVPEAVAYVDLATGGFQGNRPLATEVVTTLAPRGRGLVTYDEGLNAADQVAQRSGMPSAVIVRVLDLEGEAAPVVRRYLDRVAFKAAQEGGAIVIGQARRETVAGLVEWTIEGRSSAVSIAPLSVLLQVGR